MKGAEFERRVQKLAKEKQLTCFFVADKGKGSHGRLSWVQSSRRLKIARKN
jgi:hypothetical protein